MQNAHATRGRSCQWIQCEPDTEPSFIFSRSVYLATLKNVNRVQVWSRFSNPKQSVEAATLRAKLVLFSLVWQSICSNRSRCVASRNANSLRNAQREIERQRDDIEKGFVYIVI